MMLFECHYLYSVTLQKLAPPVVVHQSVTTSKYFSTSKVSVSASPAKTPPKVTAALEPIVINMCDDVDVVTHDSLSSVVDPAISETLAELLSMDVPEDVAALAISVGMSDSFDIYNEFIYYYLWWSLFLSTIKRPGLAGL